MPYCPYTDTTPEHTTPDHIVPLSLGGLNGYEVPADPKFNATAGTKIEGPIVNDPLFAFARRDADARGHSNKAPRATWKRSELDGEPVQVTFGDTVKVWDSKKRDFKPNEEVAGRELKSEFKIIKMAATQLAAKIAIGAIYFEGGNQLMDAINIEGLRWLATADMDAAVAAGPASVPACAEGLIVMDRFSSATGEDGEGYQWLTTFTKRTTLILQPYHHQFAVHVGLLGMFLATVCAEADHDKLHEALQCDLGKVILLGPGKLERHELRAFAKMASDHMERADAAE